jgi:hypothetical protein
MVFVVLQKFPVVAVFVANRQLLAAQSGIGIGMWKGIRVGTVAAGFKSVAHYLVETHLEKEDSPEPATADAALPVAAEEPAAPSTPSQQSGGNYWHLQT